MQQTFLNTGATYKETYDKMELQEVTVFKKKESMPSETVQKQQSCRNLLQMQEVNLW